MSDSFVERISETLDATNNYEKKDTNKTVNKLKENITSKRRSILKGTYLIQNELPQAAFYVTQSGTLKINAESPSQKQYMRPRHST